MLTLMSGRSKTPAAFRLIVIVILTNIVFTGFAQSSYSWQDPILIRNLNAENFWVYPCADLGADGETYLMYRYKNMDDVRIERWDGTSWTPITSFLKTDLPNGLSLFDYQDMAVDANNNIHIVTRGSTTNDTHGVFYGFYNGSTWSFEYIDSYAALFNSKYYVTRPIIEVDQNNNPYIGYTVRDSNPTPSQRTMKCAIKKNGSWTITNIETIVEDKGDEFDMYDFTVSASGVPHAVYSDEYNNDYMFDIRHEYYDGTSWVPTTIMSNKTTSGFLVRTDESNNAYIIMGEGASDFSSYSLLLHKNTSGSWTSETIFNAGVLDYWPADMAFNGNGDLNILYSTLDWNTWEFSPIIALQKESGTWKSFTSNTPTDYTLYSEGAYTFDDNKSIVIAYTNDLSERPRTISYITGAYSPGVTPPDAPSTPDLTAGSDSGSSNTDNITNDDTPTFTGTSQASKTIKLYANGTEVGSVTADGSGNWSITSSSLASGTYNITAKASDGNGESAASGALSVTVDTQAPTVTLSSAAADPTNASSFTVTVTFNEAVTGFAIDDINVGNGSKSGFSGSGTTYNVTVTPTADGSVTIDVAGAAANDAAGNGNTAATQLSRVSDKTSPTVTLSTTATDPTNASLITVTVTFSEAVTGFAIGDITVAGGTTSNFSGTGTTYSVDVTSTADGTVTVDVGAGAATDAATNGNTAATQLSRVVDRSGPSVSISSAAPSVTNTSPITVSIAFSESVTGFSATDVTVSGATKGTFSGSGSNYTLELIPSSNGIVTADIAGNVAQDAAGNNNTAATQFSRTYDTTHPVLTITSTTSATTNAATIPVVFSFSENVTGFVAGDVLVTNGTLQNLSGSGDSYSADIIPSADGTVSIDVSAGMFSDAAGNSNTATAQLQRAYDGTKPSVTITSTTANPANTGPINITITFSESVAGFDNSDVTVTGGSESNFSGSGATYSLDVMPSAHGTISVDVAANAANDAAGNGNTAATQYQHTYDITAPAVSISSTSDPTNSNPVVVTFTFSESVNSFTAGDVTVTGGSKGNFAGSGSSYTLEVIPSAAGTITVDVGGGAANDLAGNGNTAATQFSVVYDNTSPSVTITSTASNPNNDSQFTVNITFSESVTNFAVGDITVSGGTKSNFSGSGSSYTVDISPSADGQITVDVAANVAQDAAGNHNTAATQFSIVSDRSGPAVTLSSTASNPTNLNVIPVTITFSENVTGFDADDITVAGGSKSNFSGSLNTYSVDVTPPGDGTVTVDVAAAVATDGVGNTNTAATQFSIVSDKTKPTASLSSTVSGTTNLASFPLTISFSENMTGFDSDDITVTNGSKSNFSGSGSSYTVDITPAADGEVTVEILSAVASDAAGNHNESSNKFSVVSDRTKPSATLTTDAAGPVNTAFHVTFTFSENVTGFAQSDITAGNATVSDFQTISGTEYKALITPVTDGNVTVEIVADAALDNATNGNEVSAQLQRNYDATKPGLVISSSNATDVNSSFTVTFTFDEDVTGFDAGDVVIVNGSGSDFTVTSASVYTLLITPATDGDTEVSVNAAAALDLAGNSSTASNTLTRHYDATKPTVTVSSNVSGPVNSSFTVTFTFSETVTGFSAADVTVVNGSGGSFNTVSGSVYTMTITPNNDGEVAVSVAADVANDIATNGNEVSDILNRLYDATAPSVTLSTDKTLVNDSFTATFTFSEEVAGFDIDDITISNGFAGNLQTSDNIQYFATITPVTDGNINISVASGVAADEAGNGNTAGNSLAVLFDGTKPTAYSIASDIALVDVNNITAFSFSAADAETGTQYFYTISSSNGGTNVTGNGTVVNQSLSFNHIDLTNVHDGTLTVTFYLMDDAGNKGDDATLQVTKLTRNVTQVTNQAMITVPIRTTFAQLNLPETVEVTYSSGEKQFVSVTWSGGSYDGTIAGVYELSGDLTLPSNATNNDGFTASVTVTVSPNQSPTGMTLSATSFEPDISPVDPIGSFTTEDADDTEHYYELVSGEGDDHNDYFSVSGNEIFLNSGNSLSGITQFLIRVRSTDPYDNMVEQKFTLTKLTYTPPAVEIKIPNSFSPNGDGVNDEWVIPELKYYNDVVVEVFDRAGNRLFLTYDPEVGWDGRGLNNKILLGPYFYIIQIKDTGETKQGVLMLLKR